MGQITINTCDCCELRITGSVDFSVTYIDRSKLIPQLIVKLFCSTECLRNYVNSEYERQFNGS